MAKYTTIGGQALIEGIMMKNPKKKTALAVRKPDKTIDISFIEEKSIKDKIKFLKLPILRGVVTYIETMIQGYKAMMKSAEISGFTDIDDEKTNTKERAAGENVETETPEEIKKETKSEPKKDSAFMAVVMTLASLIGIGMAIVLFIVAPTYAVEGLAWLFGTTFSAIGKAALTQSIKIVILVLYMWVISFMKDIHRVFAYHGAEHKTIFCYEAGLDLTVENVRKQKRLHPRCGTSFLILMILINIFVSTLMQMAYRPIYENALLRSAVGLLMLPLICGLGYELLKICGKYDNLFTKIVSAPGMWLQKITTKEPEDDMIEIAIAALKACDEIVDESNEEEKEQNDDI